MTPHELRLIALGQQFGFGQQLAAQQGCQAGSALAATNYQFNAERLLANQIQSNWPQEKLQRAKAYLIAAAIRHPEWTVKRLEAS